MSPRILLVEDEAELSGFLTEFLTHLGYTVEPAYDGPSALEQMRRAPPALAVIDLMLPGMGGFELIRTLRADPRLAQLPVLVCTARREARFPADTVQAVLYKPFDPHVLGEQVRALLGGA
jgi:DNA-binding response OmpR family regulator